jgi:hypothetical protein
MPTKCQRRPVRGGAAATHPEHDAAEPSRSRRAPQTATRERRELARHIAEVRPGWDRFGDPTPAGPCPDCGDRVFFKLAEGAPWRCRSCNHAAALRAWRTVDCSHNPQCDPPEHVRSAIAAWFVAPEAEP